VTTTQRRSAEAGADREIHQIINATPSTKRTLPEDRHLSVVLKKDGEPECSADWTRKIGAWKAWAKVRWLHRNPGPRVKWPWCTDPNTDKA
jgi:hypothetical protein